jgi:hypothetical protein
MIIGSLEGQQKTREIQEERDIYSLVQSDLL